MQSLYAVLLVATLQGQPVEAGVSESVLSGFIASKVPQNWSERYREKFGSEYAKRILIEGKRRKLNPLILTAIAWSESDFKPAARGKGTERRAGEVGVWQLIPGDHSVIEAEKSLAACPVPPGLNRSAAIQWRKRAALPESKCEAPEVAAERKKPGWLYHYELTGTILGTYIAAFEIRQHIDHSIERGVKPRPIAGCKLSRKDQDELYRYGHFNSGSALPKAPYLYRLCKRYAAILQYVESANLRARNEQNGSRKAPAPIVGPRD